MAILEFLDFCYDERFSYDLGLSNVQVDASGMYEEPFMAKRTIQEVKVRGNHTPYFQGVDTEPLEFEMTFAFNQTYDDAKMREVSRWLAQTYYKPLYFLNNPDRIYYCMPVEDVKSIHNGLKQGYITLKMRCQSAFVYSPYYSTDLYDSSNVSTVSIMNLGDMSIRPEIWITKVGDGDFSIINTTNAGQEFKFTGLIDGETVYVDNYREHIETDLINIYRFDNFNNNWLELILGNNILAITGGAKFWFRYQFLFN